MSITTTPYGFIPTQVAGLALWLDASDTTTITQSSGTITQWTDKSTSALTATAVNNPTLVAKIQNGLPGISLNGSTQYFNLGNNLNMGTNQIYIFVVSKFNSTADGAIIGKSLYGSAGARYSLLRSGALIPLIEASGGAVNNSGFNSDTSTSPRLLNMVWDRSTINLYQNGSSVFSVGLSDSSNLTTGNSLLIGAYQNGSGGTPPAPGLYMNGYIHEILMYFTSTSSPLGNTSRQQIESYLAQKWGLTLGAGHPGLTSTVFRSTYLKNTVVKKNIARMIPFFTAFTPRQIGGLALWFDGADPAGTGVIPANGASISTWVDKSGRGINLTGFGSPILGTFNRLRIVNFSNSYFQNISFTQSGPLTIILIGKMNSLGGDWQTFSDNVSGLRPYVGMHAGGTPLRTAFRYGGTATTNVEIWTLTFSSSDNTVFNVNGSDVRGAATGYGGIGFTNGIRLGFAANNTAYLIGWIGEYLVYNTDLTISQYQQVESYLSQKWGLVSSLPGGHSHLTQPAGARTALSLVNSKITITSRPISFLPTSIAGIQMWMDGADPAGTGVVPSNGTVLSTWADKSGKSYSATGVNSPTVVTNAVNSKSVVSYNGSSYSYATIASGIFSTAMNIFFVYKVNGGVSYMAPMTRGQGNNGSPIDQYNNVRYLGGGSYNNIQSAYSHASATSTTLFTQLIQQSPSTTYNEYVNGSTTASASGTGFSASDAASYVYIATRDDKVTSFNGYMCELIVYNQMIGLTAQQKIEGYLAWKWGIQASLPAGHPYKSAAP
jgi:hypothetical protein